MRKIHARKGAVNVIFLVAVLLTASTIAVISMQNQNQNTNSLIYQTILPYMTIPANQPI